MKKYKYKKKYIQQDFLYIYKKIYIYKKTYIDKYIYRKNIHIKIIYIYKKI